MRSSSNVCWRIRARSTRLVGSVRDREMQTVTRCLERAAELGVIAALDDRPRAGRDPVITAEAKTWLVALACRKAKELGYPHELWTTRLLAAHARHRTVRRTSEPGQAGPGDSVQDLG